MPRELNYRSGINCPLNHCNHSFTDIDEVVSHIMEVNGLYEGGVYPLWNTYHTIISYAIFLRGHNEGQVCAHVRRVHTGLIIPVMAADSNASVWSQMSATMMTCGSDWSSSGFSKRTVHLCQVFHHSASASILSWRRFPSNWSFLCQQRGCHSCALFSRQGCALSRVWHIWDCAAVVCGRKLQSLLELIESSGLAAQRYSKPHDWRLHQARPSALSHMATIMGYLMQPNLAHQVFCAYMLFASNFPYMSILGQPEPACHWDTLH